MTDKKNTTKEICYTPGSTGLNIKKLINEIIRDIIFSRELAWRLFIRNISANYRQTFFGYAWILFPSFITTLVFVFLRSVKILNFGETEVPYALYLIVGFVLWQLFVDIINMPLKMINQSASFVTKIKLQQEAIILAGVAEVILNFMVRLILLLFVFIWFRFNLPITIFIAPVGILMLLIFGLTIGLILLPIGLLYKDIEKSLPFILMLWFILTPVIYPVSNDWSSSMLLSLNPIAPVFIATRQMFLGGSIPNILGFLLVSLVACFSLIVSWIVYRISLPHLIERINA